MRVLSCKRSYGVPMPIEGKPIMKIKSLSLIAASFICSLVVLPNCATGSNAFGQILSNAPQYAELLKRRKVGDQDNYALAAFSFKYGSNGDAAKKLTRNNWDLLFGNSPTPDAFDVSMVVDDRSRIKDLGELNWTDKYELTELPPYPEPTREPSVKAIVGHMYLVHTKDRDNDHYSLFRVESLMPGERVTISWTLVQALPAAATNPNQ
jgi:hypothetical protein